MPKNPCKLIKIKPADYSPNDHEQKLLDCATKIADLLYKNNNLLQTIREYTSFLDNTDLSRVKSDIDKWNNQHSIILKLVFYYYADDLLILFKQGCDLCNDKDDCNYLRGHILEQFANIFFKNNFPSPQYKLGFGKMINCNNTDIYYNPTYPISQDDYLCKSLDLILFNAKRIACGEFKMHPEGFKIRNLRLFELLLRSFNDNKLKSIFIFYSWDTEYSIRANIKNIIKKNNIVFPESSYNLFCNLVILKFRL